MYFTVNHFLIYYNLIVFGDNKMAAAKDTRYFKNLSKKELSDETRELKGQICGTIREWLRTGLIESTDAEKSISAQITNLELNIEKLLAAYKVKYDDEKAVKHLGEFLNSLLPGVFNIGNSLLLKKMLDLGADICGEAKAYHKSIIGGLASGIDPLYLNPDHINNNLLRAKLLDHSRSSQCSNIDNFNKFSKPIIGSEDERDKNYRVLLFAALLGFENVKNVFNLKDVSGLKGDELEQVIKGKFAFNSDDRSDNNLLVPNRSKAQSMLVEIKRVADEALNLVIKNLEAECIQREFRQANTNLCNAGGAAAAAAAAAAADASRA